MLIGLLSDVPGYLLLSGAHWSLMLEFSAVLLDRQSSKVWGTSASNSMENLRQDSPCRLRNFDETAVDSLGSTNLSRLLNDHQTKLGRRDFDDRNL